MERSGVIIAIEFCGYPRQTRTIWSAHPTAEYLSGICLMHKQFPCRRRHRQLPIITHLRSRGWTIVVSREQTRFSSPFQTLGEDREPTHLEERSSPPRGGKFCTYGGGRRIERKGGRGEIERERGEGKTRTRTRRILYDRVRHGCLEGIVANISSAELEVIQRGGSGRY